MVVLDAPQVADDAALVPITVRVPPSVRQNLKSLTLFIDKNPDPKVATLHFGPAAGNDGERSFSTRVRVDSFSHVRAVLETEDGVLHMATRFVAAAGGCGAMQALDSDSETVDLGKTIVKVFPPAIEASPIWSGQVMIKHPNSNGMQLDIHTANIIPARYVSKVIVTRGGELVFDMDFDLLDLDQPEFPLQLRPPRQQQSRRRHHRHRRDEIRRAVRAERVLGRWQKKSGGFRRPIFQSNQAKLR